MRNESFPNHRLGRTSTTSASALRSTEANSRASPLDFTASITISCQLRVRGFQHWGCSSQELPTLLDPLGHGMRVPNI